MADPTLRPDVPVTHSNSAEHRRLLAVRANAGVTIDGTKAMRAPLQLFTLTVAELTGYYAASLWTGSIIYVSDEFGGATLAFSDGTDWRRVQDRAIVT